MSEVHDLERKLKLYRLNSSEYGMICEMLGRPPQGVEWAVFSALWSEHCSYKSSRVHLRKFKHASPRVLESEGENAGVIDLGQGEKVAFKMESHNHPSFIEPYQGAATGVGGILRDIFTMGARPIALADYLCFGERKAERMTFLEREVVHGISGYGNCVGVPTVSGQTEYNASYNRNILVNAMAVGLFRKNDPMALSKAKGPGNWVVYVGAKTGKDGVHGASMASESFGENSEAKKPNVQIGDPFYEKLLIESCLEVLSQNLVVGMQDMGAAGLTSSSFEMAAKGGVGMNLHLDQVPLRDSSMSPEEILLSESQERMLLVCEPKNFEKIRNVFHRWGLEATRVGEVTVTATVRLLWRNELLTEMNPQWLTDKAPLYQRPYEAWQPKNKKEDLEFPRLSLQDFLKRSLQDERGSQREWIYQQYDQRVGARTARDARQSVAFLKLPDSGRGLAITVGCRPSVMRMDAQLGALDAIVYPALQMAIKGADALAATDCLNFGNPERSEIMTEFVASVEALAEAARIFDTPIVSGNVSFYNETLGINITSTPATGLVGLRSSVDNIPWDEFVNPGDEVFLLSLPQVDALAWSAELTQADSHYIGSLNLQELRTFQLKLRDLSLGNYFRSSKMLGNGGLLRSLALMSRFLGFKGNKDYFSNRSSGQLITEKFYEAIVAVPKEKVQDFNNNLSGLKAFHLGEVGGARLTLPDHIDMAVEEVFKFYGEDEARRLEWN